MLFYMLCVFRIAFIDFETVEEAQSAMKKMNKKTFEGRQIVIEFAETRDSSKFNTQYVCGILHYFFGSVVELYNILTCAAELNRCSLATEVGGSWYVIEVGIYSSHLVIQQPGLRCR